MSGFKRIRFLNTQIDNISMDEAISYCEKLIHIRKNAYIVTPNVDHIVKIETDPEFKNIYNDAGLILADGKPLIWISKLFKNGLKEKISGSDLLPQLCSLSSRKGYTMFFLGAAEGIAKKAAENLTKKYKGLNIKGSYSPTFGFEKNNDEIANIIRMVTQLSPDILVVALGAPKQEKFIFKYRHQLKVPVSVGVGASLDFEAGNIRRAPVWMQKAGLEWFYRLMKEPKRMYRRYLIDDIKIIRIVYKYWKAGVK